MPALEFLTAKDGKRTLSKDGIFLISKYKPEEDVSRAVCKILEGKERPFAVCFSSVLGYLTRSIQDLGISEENILVFEPDSALALDDKKNNYPGSLLKSGNHLSEILERALLRQRRPVLIALESYKKAFAADFNEFETLFTTALRISAENLKVSAYFSKVWFMNYCRNLNSALRDSGRFWCLNASRPIEKPVLIVSAGPSLNFHLEEIREKRKDFFILSVLSAVKTLLSAGIIPDAAVVSDGGPANCLHADGIPKDIPLIASVYASSALLSQKGFKVVFYDFRKEIKKPAYSLHYPSVTIDAGMIASEITRGPLIFCGFDLSYNLKAGSHSRNNALAGGLLSAQNRLNPLYNSLSSFLLRKDIEMEFEGTFSHPQFRMVQQLAEKLFHNCFYLTGGIKLKGLKPVLNLNQFHADENNSKAPDVLTRFGEPIDLYRDPIDHYRDPVQEKLKDITLALKQKTGLWDKILVREKLSGMGQNKAAAYLKQKIEKMTK